MSPHTGKRQLRDTELFVVKENIYVRCHVVRHVSIWAKLSNTNLRCIKKHKTRRFAGPRAVHNYEGTFLSQKYNSRGIASQDLDI